MTNAKKNPAVLICTACAILAAVCAVCAAVGALRQTMTGAVNKKAVQAVRQADPAQISLTVGDIEILDISNIQNELLSSWTSSDESVATVDSGGRVDAVGEGSAVISAVFNGGSAADFNVTVTAAEPEAVDNSRSTCITANSSRVKKNQSGKNKKANLYFIAVNRQANCVTVYTYDDNGSYTVPVRAMVCSTGSDNSTITGTFKIGIKEEWLSLVGGVYGRYISGISGDYLFHSVPYYTTENSELESEEFNKLGEQASRGCVRLAVADAKWIYDNCPAGTEVYIYDSADEGPLGKPDTIKIADIDTKWDPTDDDENSPYADAQPVINGAADCTVNLGGSYSMLAGVTAVDTCGSDITSSMEVKGNVVTSRAGTYKVTYSVTDAIKRHAEVTITVTVK